MEVSGITTKEIKNIIIACDYAFFEGGAANVAMESAIGLAKYTNYNVICFAGNGEPCDELKRSGAKIIALKLPDLLGNKSRINAVIKGIYNEEVYTRMIQLLHKLDLSETVVHIHSWTKVLTSAVFKACRDTGVRTFLTVHEYFLACPNGACFNYVNNSICELKPLSARCWLCNCDSRSYPQKIWRCIRQVKQNSIIRNYKNLNYIFISDFEKKQIVRRIPAIKKSYSLGNPIDIGDRSRINVVDNNSYAYIGRLSGEKGPQLFCSAVRKAGVHGIVIGDGVLGESLKREYPEIEFLGWKSKTELAELYKTIRALVFPSLWYEGSPLTVPEVMSHGIPCIVTNCSSAIDNINNQVNGEIVEPNADSIAASINRFQNDEYLKILAENAYKSFDVSRGDMSTYVSGLIKIYKAAV